MSNIMNLKSLKNNVSRNGFDLSFKKNFTAKAGELLPVMCKEVLPGDVFKIELSSFTRTQPINTAAFARIREYYDFFFVPYNLLWNKSDTVLTQMYDNAQHASSAGSTSLAPQGALNGQLPYICTSTLANYIHALYNSKEASADGKLYKNNFFGYNRADLSAKLLEYLGYGNFHYYLDHTHNWSTYPLCADLKLNLFNILAYQKIYYDFYRDSQWEKTSPVCFNVDYLSGQTAPGLDPSVIMKYTDKENIKYINMFDMRYCNWQKDLYHGVLPSPQYGETSYVVSDQRSNGGPDHSGTPTTVVDILMLRQAEFLQKWKEIAQSGDKDYKEQVQKHWNVTPSDYSSEKCQYLGGTSSNIDINEVVNTNITGDNAADIAGKGAGVGRGSINFESQGRYGVLMCIYHCLPVLDYTTDMVDPSVTKVDAASFAIPEFDKVGMQPVFGSWMSNHVKPSGDGTGLSTAELILGYAPRYIEYKTSVDQSVGAFKRSLNSWVVSYGTESFVQSYRAGIMDPNANTVFNNYITFKVNPNSVDPIFAVAAASSINTDQFLCSTFFDIKAVRNLDVDGLPY